jgi:hypothetical protein
MGIGLNAFNQGDANIRYMPYGSSIYFKYLTEHHPSGAALVRRIWEGLGAGGDGFAAIQAALGGERQYQDLFADFGAAVLLKTRAPWDFARGGEIGSTITPRLGMKDWYFYNWDETAGRIEPREIAVEPYSVFSVRFIAPEGQARATRLRIIVEPQGAAAGLRAKVVRLSGSSAAPNLVGVDDIPLEGGAPGQIVVEDYGYWLERTWWTFLLLANTTPNPIQVRVAAAVSEPPLLRRLSVLNPSTGAYLYRAQWQDREANQRELVVQANEELKVREGQVETFRVSAEFSREIVEAPTLHVGGRDVPLEKAPGVAGDWWWRVDVAGLTPDREQLKQRTLPIRIEAPSPDGLKLDANPASAASLDPEKLQWDGYDPPGGGADETHRLKLEKDLNGIWRAQDGTTVRIRHEDPSVQGSTMGGNLLFRGTLRERQITGQVKVRYPPEWRERCPGQAEGWAALELAVSEDKDTLDGRFELKEIDEECNQVHAGWKPTTLQRVPEEEAPVLGR